MINDEKYKFDRIIAVLLYEDIIDIDENIICLEDNVEVRILMVKININYMMKIMMKI